MLEKRHLDYFKKLLEGQSDVSLRGYLLSNAESLRSQFSPARLARINFKNVDEIEKILQEEKIEYSINADSVRYEKYLSTFHLDALDEKGRLKSGFKESIFDGIYKKFKEKGDAASTDLYKYIELDGTINIEKLEDIQYFGETEARFADQEFGLFILGSISSIGRQFSETDDIVMKAAEVVDKLNRRS